MYNMVKMVPNQERGFRGRFVRCEEERQQARLRALAHLVGEASIAVHSTGEALSTPEVRTLLAIAQGRPLRDITQTALAFSIPHLRKKTYKSIKNKLGARNMAHAVRLGFQDGLLSPQSIEIPQFKELSPTQKDVLELISLGAANKDVCQILGITTDTATGHMSEVKRRYNVETVEHATGVGIVIGDIPLNLAA